MPPSPARSAEIVRPARRLRGRLRVPGDKSISHRYAMLAALADGSSRIEGYAPGADCASTLSCLSALGVSVEASGPVREDAPGAAPVRSVRIAGRGLRGLGRPTGGLDAANSGTTMRLMAGIVAAHRFETTISGDASLSRRPMRRVIEPLERMGAGIDSHDGRPPLRIHGADLHGIAYRLPVASAQVKSAVLLAGIQAEGRTTIEEPVPTRDHTERALRAFGGEVESHGDRVSVAGGQRLRSLSVRVPGDVSSAAFWAIAAAALPGSEVEIEAVGLNPTRTAFLDVLRRAGAVVEIAADDTGAQDEPVGRMRVRHGGDSPKPIAIEPEEVPGLIDELPALATLAAFGGDIVVRGAAELRTKESDRIAALVAGLRALGIEADEQPDGFHVRGTRRPPGGSADAVGDHRLAMAFAIAALGASAPCEIVGADAVSVSYPGFFDVLTSLCE